MVDRDRNCMGGAMDASEIDGFPLFAGLDADELRRCAEPFEVRDVLAGTGMTREDDFAYKFFVVLDGEVDVHRDFLHVARLGPGEFFGEMGLLDKGVRNARVTAHTGCRLASMMIWEFQAMTERHPEIGDRIQEVIDRRLAALAQGR